MDSVLHQTFVSFIILSSVLRSNLGYLKSQRRQGPGPRPL